MSKQPLQSTLESVTVRNNSFGWMFGLHTTWTGVNAGGRVQSTATARPRALNSMAETPNLRPNKNVIQFYHGFNNGNGVQSHKELI